MLPRLPVSDRQGEARQTQNSVTRTDFRPTSVLQVSLSLSLFIESASLCTVSVIRCLHMKYYIIIVIACYSSGSQTGGCIEIVEYYYYYFFFINLTCMSGLSSFEL